MSFRIMGLDPTQFEHLHGLTEAQLAAEGMRRVRVEAQHAAPCRITLDDAEIGEDVLLLSYMHQPGDTPYRQQGPIFIRAASSSFAALDEVPPALGRRTLSLRGFDRQDMMIEAEVCEGRDAAGAIERFFANADVAYIHAHYARRGCFAARVDRA